jgi:transposase
MITVIGELTMKERRTFSREYKLAAVKKVVELGLTYAQVARDLGIRDNLLHNWQKALVADGSLKKAIEESPRMDAELKRLREENRQLKMERDILKKATAFFVKESF